MAATYTLATLRTAILRRVDHGDDGYFTTQWLNEEINNSAQKNHDYLIGCLGQEYATKERVDALDALEVDHELPSDFYKLVALHGLTDEGYWIPLQRYELQDRAFASQGGQWPGWMPRYHLLGISGQSKRLKFDPPADAQFCLKITYHVTPPFYDEDADVIDIPWPELVLLDVVVKCLHRQRKDAAEVISERTNLRAEIESTHPPDDRDSPPRVIDAHRRQVWPRSLKYDQTLVTQDAVGVARIRIGFTQSIPNGAVDTQVQLNAVEFADRDAFKVDEPSAGAVASPTYAITLRKNGYYWVTWTAGWGSNAADAVVQVLVNGTVLNSPAPLRLVGSATDSPFHGKGLLIKGTLGQTIGLRATRTGGGASVALMATLTVMAVDDAAKVKALVAQTVANGTNPILNLPAEEFVTGSSVRHSPASNSISVTEDGIYALVAEVLFDPAGAGLSALEFLLDEVLVASPALLEWISTAADDQSLGKTIVLSLTAGQTVKVRGTAAGGDVAMTPTLAVVRLPWDCAKLKATADQSIATVTSAVLNLPTTEFQSGSTVVPGTNSISVTETSKYLLIYDVAVSSGFAGDVTIEILVDDAGLGAPAVLQWNTNANDGAFGKSETLYLAAGQVIKLRATNVTTGSAFFRPSLTVVRLP